MSLIVATIALLSLGLGVYSLVSPTGMMSLVSRFDSLSGYRAAIALRLLLAVALYRVAPDSRAPRLLQGLAVVAATAAVALSVLGSSRYHDLLSWWSRQSVARRRLSAVVSAALGAVLLWSIR